MMSHDELEHTNPDDVLMRFPGPPLDYAGDDSAEEYVIIRFPAAFQGFIVYGRYGDKWIANCGYRGVVRHLMDQLKK